MPTAGTTDTIEFVDTFGASDISGTSSVAVSADDVPSTETASGQAAAGQSETQTDSQAAGASGATGESDQSGAVTQAAPAAVPRTVVVAPDIVGIMNGRLTYLRDGLPAPEVAVDLLLSDEAGTVGGVFASTVSDADGRYGFDVDDGCYAMLFTAPEGYRFPGIGKVLTGPSICVTADTPFSLGASLEAAG